VKVFGDHEIWVLILWLQEIQGSEDLKSTYSDFGWMANTSSHLQPPSAHNI
jgi:hypothetical protein